MKISTRTYFGFFLVALAATFGLANSGGAALAGNFFTGAPSTGGGTESTCSTCHAGGSFGEPQLNVNFAGSDGIVIDTLTQYIPGETYTVTVAVGYNNAPTGYGFQSQFLTTDATPVAAGLATNPATGVQVTEANMRQYIEHDRVSEDSLFTFEWTAPAAGTGQVNMYLVGNLVNRSGGTRGDNGSSSPLILNLNEGTPSSTRDLATVNAKLYPNPTLAGSHAVLEFTSPRSDEIEFRILDLGGQVMQRLTINAIAGPNFISLPTAELPTGIYIVNVRGQEYRATARLVVR